MVFKKSELGSGKNMEHHLDCDQIISRRKVIKKQAIMTESHFHEEYELYYMLEGRVTYFIGDEIYHIDPGNFVFIPRGVPHRTVKEHTDSNERILLSIHPDIFSEKTACLLEVLSASRIICVPDCYLPELERILLKAEAEYTQKENHSELMIELYILQLLVLLCRYKCERKPNIKDSNQIVYRISDYIRANYGEEITLGKLSKIFSISEEYLSRKFKAVAGIGISQFLTYVRISGAERLLRESQLSVIEIAERCGFNDSNYFSTVFKKIKGISPLAYRKCERLKNMHLLDRTKMIK